MARERRLSHAQKVEVPTPTTVAAAGFRDRMPRRGRTFQGGCGRTRTSAGLPLYSLAGSCRSRWATHPECARGESNSHVLADIRV